MRIIINTSHQRFGGAIQVALSFIYECIHFPENEYYVWVGPGVKKSLKKSEFPSNFEFQDFDFGIINFSTPKKIQQTLEPLEKKIKPNIIITTSGPSYFHSKAPQIMGFNLGLYIYPDSPFVKSLPLKKKLKLFLKRKAHFFYFKRDATAYLVQTDDVNHRVRKSLNTDRVYTISNTFSNFYKRETVFPQFLPEPKDNEIRLVTISSYYPHKNFEIIPKIIQRLREKNINNIRFVLTLKESDFLENLEDLPEIINIGPVKPEECPSLYNECDIMFLPTLAECFSASYPEAMIKGKPIITTDLGFARSICGEAALYYKPKDAQEATEVIIKLINDLKLKETLIKKGSEQLNKFDSARARAEKYLKICKEISIQHEAK